MFGSAIGIGFGYNYAFVGGAAANWVFLIVYCAICGTSDTIVKKATSKLETK